MKKDPCSSGLMVIDDHMYPGEGIGAIAMLFKQPEKLARLLNATSSSYDYRSNHGYTVSEVLPGMVRSACSRTIQACHLSTFLTQDLYNDLTIRDDHTALPALRQHIELNGCNVLLIDLISDHLHQHTDILDGYIPEGVAANERLGKHVTINAHVRWGDTSTGTYDYAYGREKTCNLTSAALAAQQALATGRQVTLNVFTEIGLDGSLPPLDEIESLSQHIRIITDTEPKDIVRDLAACDILVAGGSQLSVLVAYGSPARVVVMPDRQLSYIMDAKRFGDKYMTSQMFEEGLESLFA